jgi:uncharacterized protein (DUF1501 family)
MRSLIDSHVDRATSPDSKGGGSMRRRAFLRNSALLGGAAAFFGVDGLSGFARAQAAVDRYYVFAYFSGGWDVLLGLDPRNPGVFNNGNLTATKIQPGYELLPVADQQLVTASTGVTFGPFIGDLVNHANRLAVVRGLSMDTLTHEVGRRRFLTGKQPSGLSARGSSAGTWMASRLGAEQPVPNLVVGTETYNVDQPTFATGLRVASGNDLVRALRQANPLASDVAARNIDFLLGRQAECNVATRSAMWQQAEESRKKADQTLALRLDRLFDFAANTPEMSALRTRYGFAANALGSPEAQAAMAAQALMGGVSRAVTLEVAGGLDTHFQNWATEQGPRQRRGFNAIARLASHLAETEYPDGSGDSWLDRTTIVGFSEFSRTPLLNSTTGRDHHLTNSCFLLGGNVRGGAVVGASSDDGMLPQPVNLETGLVDAGGELVKPDHVLQTLFNDAGVGDAPDLRVAGLPTLLR